MVQTLAVTATATAAVIADIRQSLRMRPSDAVFKETFDRPNLSYSVHVKTSMTEDLKQVSAPSTKHTPCPHAQQPDLPHPSGSPLAAARQLHSLT